MPHSLLMDTKTGNPLILTISCRRCLFLYPKGLYFCVKACGKLRGHQIAEWPSQLNIKPLCICSLPVLPKVTLHNLHQTPLSVHRTAALHSLIMQLDSGVLWVHQPMLKHIFGNYKNHFG